MLGMLCIHPQAIIDILGDQIRLQIITKVKVAQWFSVIADEATDAANKEQLSLVL